MPRYEVIESKAWKSDDGRSASLYGAVPWTSPSEEKRWKVVTRGYTVRDNERGTVGIGRLPWPTRAEAQAWVDKEHKRLADLAAARGRGTKPSHSAKKSSVQLDREIAEVIGARPLNKRKRVRHFSEWTDRAGRTHYGVTYEDRSGHTITREALERYRQREAKG